MDLKFFPENFPFTGSLRIPLQWFDIMISALGILWQRGDLGLPSITVHGAENSEPGIWVPGRPLKVRGWVWRFGGSPRSAPDPPRGTRGSRGPGSPEASRGPLQGWGGPPSPRAAILSPPPCPELPVGLRPAAPLAHTLLPSAPRPLPTSESSLRAQPRRRRAPDAPRRAGLLESRRASGPGAAGAAPSPREGGGTRPEGKGGPEGASGQRVCRDWQVSAQRRDEAVPPGC